MNILTKKNPYFPWTICVNLDSRLLAIVYSNNELKYVGNPTFNNHDGCECLNILNIHCRNQLYLNINALGI